MSAIGVVVGISVITVASVLVWCCLMVGRRSEEDYVLVTIDCTPTAQESPERR